MAPKVAKSLGSFFNNFVSKMFHKIPNLVTLVIAQTSRLLSDPQNKILFSQAALDTHFILHAYHSTLTKGASVQVKSFRW